jgi:hypothetical protein
MKTVKIFYNYSLGSFEKENVNCLPEDYFIEPKRYTADYDSGYQHSRCPAWKEYYKNTFTLYQQFPLKIKYDSDAKFLNTNLLLQNSFDRYFKIHNDWINGKYPEFQMILSFVFWTEEKDIWIEQLHHPDMSHKGLDIVSGTFPLSVWERPLNLGVLLRKPDEEISLDRGTALCNVRFTKNNHNDIMVKLSKKDVPGDIYKKISQNNEIKKWHSFGSWDLIKKRIDRSEKGKCPFSMFWN